MNLRVGRRALLAIAATLISGPALAHHGWRWTEDGVFELTGVIRDIYLGNPHAHLDVDVDGDLWRVELAPPGATRAAGFVEGVAAVGDEVTAWGNRSADQGEHRMKAVRLAVNGAVFDVYPRRTAPLEG